MPEDHDAQGIGHSPKHAMRSYTKRNTQEALTVRSRTVRNDIRGLLSRVTGRTAQRKNLGEMISMPTAAFMAAKVAEKMKKRNRQERESNYCRRLKRRTRSGQFIGRVVARKQ